MFQGGIFLSFKSNPVLIYLFQWKIFRQILSFGVSQQILLFMKEDSDQDGFDPTIRSIFILDLDTDDQSGRFPVIRSRSIIPFTTHVTRGTKVQSVRAAVQVECIDHMHVIGT